MFKKIIPAAAALFSTATTYAQTAAAGTGIKYDNVTTAVTDEMTNAGPVIATVLGLSLAVLLVVKLVKRAH